MHVLEMIRISTVCKSIFYKGRTLEDIAVELGVTRGTIQERIRRDVRRLWRAARKMYDSNERGEMCE